MERFRPKTGSGRNCAWAEQQQDQGLVGLHQARAWQDENNVEFFDDDRHVRAPKEAFIKRRAETPHCEVLTCHVLTRPNEDRGFM